MNKVVSLRGAQVGVDARTRAAVPEAVVNGAGGAFILSVTGIVLDGFAVQDASTTTAAGIVTDVAGSGYQIRNNIVQNNRIGIYLKSRRGGSNRGRKKPDQGQQPDGRNQ